MHDFKTPISYDNLEGATGLELATMNAFLCSKVDKVIIYNAIDFMPIDELPIKLLKADTREPPQIIAMQKNADEELLAVISGKLLIMNT